MPGINQCAAGQACRYPAVILCDGCHKLSANLRRKNPDSFHEFTVRGPGAGLTLAGTRKGPEDTVLRSAKTAFGGYRLGGIGAMVKLRLDRAPLEQENGVDAFDLTTAA